MLGEISELSHDTARPAVSHSERVPRHEGSRAEARSRRSRWRSLRDDGWVGSRDVSMEGGTADAGLHKVKES
jgi:hypothetical protein